MRPTSSPGSMTMASRASSSPRMVQLQASGPTGKVSDRFELEAEFGKAALNAANLVAGIDDDGLAGFLVAQDGAVAGERADGEGFEDHGFYCRAGGRSEQPAGGKRKRQTRWACLSKSWRTDLERPRNLSDLTCRTWRARRLGRAWRPPAPSASRWWRAGRGRSDRWKC